MLPYIKIFIIMYEKLKNFFTRYWFVLVVAISLGALVFLGIRSIKRTTDTLVKNNKINITISKSKTK